MSRQTQWLFEVPPTSEGDRLSYINPEYYNHPEWESEWELPEAFPLSEEEWETVGALKVPRRSMPPRFRGAQVPRSVPSSCPPVSTQPRIVYGWTQYKRRVEDLPPDQQAMLRKISNEIRMSYQPGCQPIQKVQIYGHADWDTPRNPQREKQMSDERAQMVTNWLKKEVGSKIAAQITWDTQGFAATKLKAKPTTEANRRQNRRVEILMSVGKTNRKGSVQTRVMTVFPPGAKSLINKASASASTPPQMRPCCLLEPGSIIDSRAIGMHRGGNEVNGIIYTGVAGFIDLGHIRDLCDVTNFVFQQLLNGQSKIDINIRAMGVKKVLGLPTPFYSEQLVGTAELVSLNLNLSVRDQIRLARSIALDYGKGHEIISYPINVPGMHNSSFSPEDLCSNFLGTLLAERALVTKMTSSDYVINTTGTYEARVTQQLNQLLTELKAQSPQETLNAFNLINGRWVDHNPSLFNPTPHYANTYLKRRNFTQTPWKAGHSSDQATPSFFSDTLGDQQSRYTYIHREGGSAIPSSEYPHRLSMIRADACHTQKYGSNCDKP